MRIPSGSLDANGKTAKGEVILTVGEDQVALQEFGTTTEGDKTSCYVLTSDGDIPTMRFALNANIADHADFVVDGVLRNCQSSSISKTFKGSFEKALYQGMKTKTKRGAAKYSKMQVKERVSIIDVASTNSSTPSAVGSLELRLYRTDPETSDEVKSSEDDTPHTDQADRAPAYDKCAEWYDCNSNLNFEGPLPPFQIDFVEHKDAGKAIKDRVLKDLPTNCKVWATFVFHLRSTADLRSLGFECPIYYSSQSPMPTTSKSRAGSQPAKAEDFKQEPTDTSIDNSLVGDFVENTPRKNPEVVETEKRKTSPRPAPVLAPRATLSSLLNKMSSSKGEESLDVSDNSEGRSNRGSMTPNAERSNRARAIDPNTRYYSSQGLGLSITGAGLERLPVLERPKHLTTAKVPVDSEEEVETKQMPSADCDTPRKSRERGPGFLPGVTGVKISPAHKAFLERPATEETESREATPTPAHDDALNGDGDDSTGSQHDLPDIFARRDLSQPPEVLASMEGKSSMTGNQGEELVSVWQPSTPPAASLKRHFQAPQRESAGLDAVWGGANTKLGISSVKKSLEPPHPKEQSTNADGLLTSSFPLLDDPRQSSFAFLKPALPGVNSQAESSQGQAAFQKAPSEAPSETDTEIAEPEDIERMVKASQRSTQTTNTSHVPPQSVPLNGTYFKSDMTADEEANHTHPSPILGSRRFSNTRLGVSSPLSRSFTVHTENPSTPGSPNERIRNHSHAEPSTPGPDTSDSARIQPQTPNNLSSTPVIKQSMSQTPTPLKRKSDKMTGSETPETVNPKKTSIAPADRNQRFENDKAAAEARIVAAERKREELQKRLEAAREVKREMDKVQELHQKAADVERENAEMEAEIAAIYGAKTRT